MWAAHRTSWAKCCRSNQNLGNWNGLHTAPSVEITKTNLGFHTGSPPYVVGNTVAEAIETAETTVIVVIGAAYATDRARVKYSTTETGAAWITAGAGTTYSTTGSGVA